MGVGGLVVNSNGGNQKMFTEEVKLDLGLEG